MVFSCKANATDGPDGGNTTSGSDWMTQRTGLDLDSLKCEL